MDEILTPDSIHIH